MSRMRSFENARWMVEFYHQWDSFLPRVNWRDFTFICIEGEWNHGWPLVEVRLVLLGLGIRVVRQLDPGEDDLPASDDLIDSTMDEEPELRRTPTGLPHASTEKE